MKCFSGKILIEFLLVVLGHLLYSGGIKTSTDVIRSDGKGYYDYLPAVFIYNDLQFGFRSMDFPNTEKNLAHSIPSKNGLVNKYTCGAAVLWSPFFGVTHLYLKSTAPQLATGYSEPYHQAIYIAALFYLLAGLVGLRLVMAFFKVNYTTVFFLQVAVLFATNLFAFSFIEASFTHVYSFALITFFVLTYLKFINSFRYKYIYLASFLLGLIVLVRPFNIICVVFLPFLSGGFSAFNTHLNFFLREKKKVVWTVLVFLLVVSVQFIIWYVQSGRLLPWTYQEEGFDFSQPALWQTLFGFRKGLFIYTPVLLLAFSIFFVLIKKRDYQKLYSLLLALFLIHYAIASWETWWYGFGFGLRPYIDFYIFFVIMAAMALPYLHSMVRNFKLMLVGLFIFLNLIQTYQFTHYILHGAFMDFTSYKTIFLSTDKNYVGYVYYRNQQKRYQKLLTKKVRNCTVNSVDLLPGQWKGLYYINDNVSNSDFNHYVFEADMTIPTNDTSVLHVNVGDTLNKSFHYEQRFLFHLTNAKTGRQKVRYYFSFKSLRNTRAKFTWGFMYLQNKVTLHSLKLKRLVKPQHYKPE